MTRQQFIDACIISMADSKYHSAVDLAWQTAVKLADERAKHCPFDDGLNEGISDGLMKDGTPDPYAVNWNDAPQWANWHAVDDCGTAVWFDIEPYMNNGIWYKAAAMSKASHYIVFKNNPNWRESLRKRP